jgi:hypothetical protein
MSGDPTVDALMQYVDAAPDDPEASPEDTDAAATAEEQPKVAEPILGKYETKEAARSGLHNLIQKLATETAARTTAEERTRALEAELSRAKTRTDAPSLMTDTGEINPEALSRMVDERASTIADEKMKPVMTAIQSAVTIGEAEQAMLNEHGNSYYENMPAFREFLAENPKVAELVTRAESNGQPLLARQYGYAEFLHAQDKTADADLKKRGEDRNQKRDAAQKDATILSSKTVPTGGAKPKITREKLNAIVDSARKGDYSAFDKEFSVRGLPSEEELRRITGWS